MGSKEEKGQVGGRWGGWDRHEYNRNPTPLPYNQQEGSGPGSGGEASRILPHKPLSSRGAWEEGKGMPCWRGRCGIAGSAAWGGVEVGRGGGATMC